MNEIKIYDNVVIPCPEYGFNLRQAKHCIKCKHFLGMVRATIDGKEIEGEDWQAFQVRCGRPITRRMQEIVME